MEKLSDTEMYIWDYLEDNKAKVQQLSITQLAELAHVGTATVVRALKKRGFDGFSDYKNSLKRGNTLEDSVEVTVPGLSSLAKDYVYKNLDEVARTIQLLDSADLEAICQKIDQAGEIITVARGADEKVSEVFVYRLLTIGKMATTRAYDDMAVYLEALTEKDLIFVISSRGEDVIIEPALKKAKKTGASIVTLTSDYQSTLGRLADYSLLAYKSKLEHNSLLGDAGSNMTMELVARLLIDLYGVYKENGTIKS